MTPQHRARLRQLAEEDRTRIHNWSDRIYQATASPNLQGRSVSSQSEPITRNGLAHAIKPLLVATVSEARVPELAYTQVFQSTPDSQARIEVVHFDGKVQIKSSDLEISEFSIEQEGRGWRLSFAIGGTPKSSPQTTPQSTTRRAPHGRTTPTPGTAYRRSDGPNSPSCSRGSSTAVPSRPDSPGCAFGSRTPRFQRTTYEAAQSPRDLSHPDPFTDSLPSESRFLSPKGLR
jgi:hypothetical protein